MIKLLVRVYFGDPYGQNLSLLAKFFIILCKKLFEKDLVLLIYQITWTR